MDFSYSAILWNPNDHSQAFHAAKLIEIFDSAFGPATHSDGLAVYTQKPAIPYLKTHKVFGDRGVLLGILFDQITHRRIDPEAIYADPEFSNACLERGSQHLNTRYWGAYVAFIVNRRKGLSWIFRDCSGMIPCYYATVRGVIVATSEAPGLLPATRLSDSNGPFLSLDINWRYLAAYVARSDMQIRESGFTQVNELLAGETLTHQSDHPFITSTWSPENFVDIHHERTIDKTVEKLRETIHTTISSWASQHQWIIHTLSGGFDSSLVLSMLTRLKPRPHIVCINRFSTGPAEDERHYARIAANTAGTPLIEWPWLFGDVPLNEGLLNIPLTLKPSITALTALSESSFLTALRSAQRFDAIWTGQGGDHILMATKTPLIATDFIRIRGMKSGLIDTLYDANRLTGQSIPHIVLTTLFSVSHLAPTRLLSDRLPNLNLLTNSPYASDLSHYIRHPWEHLIRGLPPAKRYQISHLVDVLHRHRPLAGTQDAVELHPLISQPILEYCLSIPTYMLLHGGRTRGLARRAFSDAMPTDIVNREQKGQTTHHTLGMFRKNQEFISAFLLDGILTQNGLLNLATLKSLLLPHATVAPTQLFPLFACLATEAWVRTWLTSTDPGSSRRTPTLSS